MENCSFTTNIKIQKYMFHGVENRLKVIRACDISQIMRDQRANLAMLDIVIFGSYSEYDSDV